jgi:hypothetical protein
MTLDIRENPIVRRGPNVLTSAVGDEVVLMSIERGRYYGLDRIASVVWRHIEHPVRFAALVEALATHYQGDAARIASDVGEMLSKIQAEGLVEIGPGRD